LFSSAAAEGKAFDLVILDVTVAGGMGGKECLQQMLAPDPTARIVLSSGYSDDALLANHRQYGARSARPKPYRTVDLQRALQEVFDPQ
jgi:DNA-binding NarL/FixJ family response regulator